MAKYRETAEITSATVRLIRAISARVEADDPGELRHLRSIEKALAEAWPVAISGLRQSGFTDAQIGKVLGVTQQAVQQRWPRPKVKAS